MHCRASGPKVAAVRLVLCLQWNAFILSFNLVLSMTYISSPLQFCRAHMEGSVISIIMLHNTALRY